MKRCPQAGASSEPSLPSGLEETGNHIGKIELTLNNALPYINFIARKIGEMLRSTAVTSTPS